MPGVPPTGGQIVQAAKDIHRYYTAVELANLARDAGFRDDVSSNDDVGGKARQRDGSHEGRYSELQIAVALALAESGGDRLAVSSAGCKGLWQICPAGDDMFDPATNADAAWGKYQGAGFRFTPWSTFGSRAYIPKLPAAAIAVRRTHRDRPGFTGGGTGAVHDLIAFTGDVGHDLGAFFGWITSGSTWIRLGEALAGAVLVFLALYVLVINTRTGQRTAAAIGGKGIA